MAVGRISALTLSHCPSAGVIYFYPRISLPVWITSYLAPGLWGVAGRSSYHIGARMVYGLAFFLFFIGV